MAENRSSASLPNRRLHVMGHGVWDEERKKFYPFRISNGTLAARPDVAYFIHMAEVSSVNSGDHVASTDYWALTDFAGNAIGICFAKVPETVAASNVNAGAESCCMPDILCRLNTAVTKTSTSTACSAVLVYAEIPTEPAR